MKALRDYWDHRRRVLVGAVLFFGAIVASLVLEVAGVMYGWGVVGVFGAFVAGALLLVDS